MSKVAVIGIDALDPRLLDKFRNELPNFSKMMDEGKSIKMKSVFPTDSIPAWASIYSGMNPANHGFLVSRDYISRDTSEQERNFAKSIDTSFLHGKTFWDFASKSGKKVCIINPFLCYPVWPVNGVMVCGPIFQEGDIQSFPSNISNKYDIPHMGGIGGFPLKHDLVEFFNSSKAITLDEANFGLKLLEDFSWDLYFICFLTLDRIQHFFWRYFDENDPTHPRANRYSNVIKYFYKMFDELLGKFTALMDSSTTLVIVSDHGHGMRNTKLANVNEVLRRKKLLFPKKQVPALDFGKLLEKIKKRLVIDFIRKYEIEELAFGLARLIPRANEFQQSSFIIDFDKSIAYVSDLFGMHTYGGIKINSNAVEEKTNYEEIRRSVINTISSLKDEETGKKIAKWVCKREELYVGKHIEKYPDVVFQLLDDYGVDRSLYGSIIGTNYTHKVVSGGHQKDATFLLHNFGDKRFPRKEATLMDIAPSILELLDIKTNKNFDGKSIFQE